MCRGWLIQRSFGGNDMPCIFAKPLKCVHSRRVIDSQRTATVSKKTNDGEGGWRRRHREHQLVTGWISISQPHGRWAGLDGRRNRPREMHPERHRIRDRKGQSSYFDLGGAEDSHERKRRWVGRHRNVACSFRDMALRLVATSPLSGLRLSGWRVYRVSA